ncbi:MAG: cell division protein FtsQ/DivIB [Acidimicrobiia bacterium]
MIIDPRLRERRKAVAEERARHSVRRLIRFLVLAGIAGAAVWFLFSPWMRVAQVRTSGIVVSDSYSILASHRVVAGTPMILLKPSQVEEALEEDPWIRSARVHRRWPDEVIVQVEERAPAAWVETTGGWSRRALDGVALPSPTGPNDELPRVRLPNVADVQAETSPWVLGAIEFAQTLHEAGGVNSELWVDGGELWADVEGFSVRLGRPGEMEAKALALLALLSEPLPEGATLVLIAPDHPAVSPPSVEDGVDTSVPGEGDGD